MSCKIFFATESDVPDILRFVQALAKYERLDHEVLVTEELLRKNLFGPQKFAEVLLLQEGPRRVGFALFFHNFSTFLGLPGIYLEDLFILEEFRNKGYGKKLLAHLAGIAVERGCGRLEWSVLDWNQPAIDFYLSLGAKQMSEWTVHRLDGPELVKLSHGCSGLN